MVQEEPGESLSDCERDKDDEVLDEDNMKEDSDDESDDGFFVPDGYLSENEVFFFHQSLHLNRFCFVFHLILFLRALSTTGTSFSYF